MPEAIWSPESISDLEEVALYIAVQGGRPMTADRIVQEAHQLANLVATQPEMGAAYPELSSGIRAVSFKKRWVVIYHIVPGGIEVVRFVDGARDFDQLF